MPRLTVATFNLENLMWRFKFRERETAALVSLLDATDDGERDALVRSHWNVLNAENRVFTALAVAESGADLVCLQEVDNGTVLKWFHDRFVRPNTNTTFPFQYVVEGNDGRGIDVAVMGTADLEIDGVKSHRTFSFGDIGAEHLKRWYLYDNNKLTFQVFDHDRGRPVTPGLDDPVFRRDCLEVSAGRDGRVFPIFILHLKSMAGGRDQTRRLRQAECLAVRRIIETRFADPAEAEWLVVGDLNDYVMDIEGTPDTGHGLGPLLDDGFSINLVERREPHERWTHYWTGGKEYRQLDYILASPALAARNPGATPKIVREGLAHRAALHDGARYPRIGWDQPKASDHCPVSVALDFEGYPSNRFAR